MRRRGWRLWRRSRPEGKSRDGEDGRGHGPEGDGKFLAQAAHLAQVLLAAQGVNDGAGGEEEQRLEEGVRDEMEDGRGVGRDAAGKKHVAELRDGGVGKHALDVVLGEADGGGEEGGGRADDGDDGERDGRAVKEQMGAGDHVDAGGDHGGGVDERGDGRGALHGVGQPDVERELRAFAGGAEQQAETDDGEDAAVPRRIHGEQRGDLAEGERAEGGKDEEDADEEAEVADAVDDEGLFAGVGGGVALEVEADEQIGGEAHALPADEHEQDVAGEDQEGHEEEKEIEEAEVARVAGLVVHVADGINVDEEADAGDDQQHDQRELIEDKAEIDVEWADGEPGERECFHIGNASAVTGPQPGQLVAAEILLATKAFSTRANDASGASTPMTGTSRLGSREPRIPLSRKPAKGSSGISQRWGDSFIASSGRCDRRPTWRGRGRRR